MSLDRLPTGLVNKENENDHHPTHQPSHVNHPNTNNNGNNTNNGHHNISENDIDQKMVSLLERLSNLEEALTCTRREMVKREVAQLEAGEANERTGGRGRRNNANNSLHARTEHDLSKLLEEFFPKESHENNISSVMRRAAPYDLQADHPPRKQMKFNDEVKEEEDDEEGEDDDEDDNELENGGGGGAKQEGLSFSMVNDEYFKFV